MFVKEYRTSAKLKSQQTANTLGKNHKMEYNLYVLIPNTFPLNSFSAVKIQYIYTVPAAKPICTFILLFSNVIYC